MHTPTMTLKNAALLALIGMTLLTILLLAALVNNLFAFTRGLIPMTALLLSCTHSFAALSVAVFFYAFHGAQS